MLGHTVGQSGRKQAPCANKRILQQTVQHHLNNNLDYTLSAFYLLITTIYEKVNYNGVIYPTHY